MTAPVRLVGASALLALTLVSGGAAAIPVRTDRGRESNGGPSLLGGASLPVVEPSPLDPAQRPPAVPFPVGSPVTAGWRDGMFFVSDSSHDWFISPGARLQVDFHTFAPISVTDDVGAGPGARPADVRTGFQLRRARVELAGGVMSFLTWRLGAELTDNGPQTAADLLLNLRAAPTFNVQLGQFDAPFTLENRTSDRYLDFLERSLTVRALGVPTGKEIGLMFWGEDDRRVVHWSAGVFNGAGPNRFSTDNQVEGAARVFVHPFMVSHPRGIGRRIQIGASGRVATRSLGGQSPYPAMTTPGGYTLFSPALASDVTLVARGLQWALAGEIDLPLHRFDLRGEFVYVRNQTGEVTGPLGGALDRDPVRLGTLEGFGFYVQMGYWVLGLPGTELRPGYQDPPTLRVERAQPLLLPLGLQLVGRFDTVQFAYRGASVDPRGQADSAASGQYRVLAAEFGVNVWFTRHARVLFDYRHYWFPDQPGEAAADVNRMQGPATRAGAYGEFSTRLALSL